MISGGNPDCTGRPVLEFEQPIQFARDIIEVRAYSPKHALPRLGRRHAAGRPRQ